MKVTRKEWNELRRELAETKVKLQAAEAVINNDKKMHGEYATTTRFARIQVEDARKEADKRKKMVCIDTDTIIGKEIMYQTTLLREILHEVRGENSPQLKPNAQKRMLNSRKNLSTQEIQNQSTGESDQYDNSIRIH